eukprot:5337528-Prymnesium_polylepis.1
MDTQTLQEILHEVIFLSDEKDCKESLSLSDFAHNASPILARLKKENETQYYCMVDMARNIYICDLHDFWTTTTYRRALITAISSLLTASFIKNLS